MNVDECGAFLFVARGDADDALNLLVTKSRNAGYLAAQAIEKTMKAVLKFYQIDFPATEHRLDTLLDKFPQDSDWRSQFEDLVPFQAYSTSYRYTDGAKIRAPAPEGRVRHVASQVKALIDVACEEMNITLGDSYEMPVKHW